jgi:predicted transcriptional regulator
MSDTDTDITLKVKVDPSEAQRSLKDLKDIPESNTKIKVDSSDAQRSLNDLKDAAVDANKETLTIGGPSFKSRIEEAKGAVMAVAASCAAFAHAIQQVRQQKLDAIFGQIELRAKSMSSAISTAIRELSRLEDLRVGTSDITQKEKAVEHQTALANLEAEKQRALRGAIDADKPQIEADFARKQAKLEHDYATNVATAGKSETLAANNERIEELKELLANVTASFAENTDRALFAGRQIGGLSQSGTGIQVLDDAKRLANINSIKYYEEMQSKSSAAAEADSQSIRELGAEIKALEDANVLLAKEITAAAGAIALADAEFAAKNESITTALAEAEEVAKTPKKHETIKDSTSTNEIISDRLSRIGGFVGGQGQMKRSEDLLTEGNRQRVQIIDAINRGRVGTFG